MANPEHLEILKQGVEAWNKWKRKDTRIRADLSEANLCCNYLYGADLSGANLFKADLSGTNLIKAYFIGANLSEASLRDAYLNEASLRDAYLISADLRSVDLSGADLSHVYLCGANLRYADLRHADLSGADLSNADLIGAVLWRANLSETNLENANFWDAQINRTIFANTDLSAVIGLDSVCHTGPSYISIDTLYKSRSKTPESFLRGCGVPDELILSIPSIIGAQQVIQFYSCFISYSTKDEEFSRRLHSRMRKAKLRVWFAPEDIKGGQKVHEQLERAIQLHDRLLIVLSEQSMQSEWVITEIRNARQAEIKENRRKLFPIRLVDFDTIRKWKCFDADTGKDLAVELREYFIPDFSNWNDHDAFEAGFDRLLRDLKAEEK